MWEILSLHITSHELELARPSTSTPRSGSRFLSPSGERTKVRGQPAEQLLTNSQLREAGQVYVAPATRICPSRGWAQSRTEGRGGSSRTSRKLRRLRKLGDRIFPQDSKRPQESLQSMPFESLWEILSLHITS